MHYKKCENRFELKESLFKEYILFRDYLFVIRSRMATNTWSVIDGLILAVVAVIAVVVRLSAGFDQPLGGRLNDSSRGALSSAINRPVI